MIARLTVSAALAFAAAGTAQAQYARRQPAKPAMAEAARVIHSWSSCTAKRHRGDARQLLQMDYRTEQYDDALRKLARKSQNCLYPGDEIRIHGSLLFAGGLAEALYERDHAQFDVEAFGRRLAAAPAITARDNVEMIGLCVARRAHGNVRAMLVTKPASAEERAAIATLTPTFEECVAAGMHARMSRAALRSLFALGLYRWSLDASVVADARNAKLTANA